MRNRIYIYIYVWNLRSRLCISVAIKINTIPQICRIVLRRKIECEQAVLIKNIYEYIILISFATQKNSPLKSVLKEICPTTCYHKSL